MAGEKKGKAYEALVHVALQELVDAKKLAGPLHWNVIPKGMSIEPDFMTGKDQDAPKTILLLTHSGSAKESEKKMWRNFGELVEGKTLLPNMPRVYGLTFGSIKTDLEPIQQHAFDQFVWVRQATHSWADDLYAFIAACVPAFPKGKDTQTDFIRDELKQASAKVKTAFRQLKSLLETMHKAKSVTLDKMWADHRKRTVPPPPGARRTFLRRGSAKISLIGSLSLSQLLIEPTGCPKDKCPEFIVSLGLGTPNAAGTVRSSDPEIAYCIKHIDTNSMARILHHGANCGLVPFLNDARSIALLPHQLGYIRDSIHAVINPTVLAKRLTELHDDPLALLSDPGVGSPWPPRTVWLFDAILTMLRNAGRNATAIGYAQIAAEAIREFGLGLKTGGEPRDFRIVVPDWIQRRGNETMSGHVLDAICTVLARKLSLLTDSDFEKIAAIPLAELGRHQIETKLIPYRMFDPLYVLIESAKPGVRKLRQAVCFREAAAIGGQSGIMDLAVCNHTLINWQSAHSSHTNDKKKELCGRAIGLRYHWNGKAFVRRPGIEKMILVLDGTWKQADLNALLRAGWDEIYYPDEMDQLAKAIV